MSRAASLPSLRTTTVSWLVLPGIGLAADPRGARNDGSAPARGHRAERLGAQGWKTSFEPKEVPDLAAGRSRSVQVSLTPSRPAIAGDYQTTISANAADGQWECGGFPHHGADLDLVGRGRDRGDRHSAPRRRVCRGPLSPR